MPIITIDLLEGRTPEDIEKLIAEVSDAAARSLGAPLETVRVMVKQMAQHEFGIGGRTAGEVMAERRTASGPGAGKEQA